MRCRSESWLTKAYVIAIRYERRREGKKEIYGKKTEIRQWKTLFL